MKIFKAQKFLANIFMIVFLVGSPILALASPNVTVNYNTGSTTNGCPSEMESIADVFDLAICILKKSVWPLLISISVIVFIVGVIKYIASGDDSGKREEGRNFILYGIVGLFVIVSVWGLVGVLQGTFGLGNTPFIPQLQEE